MITCALTSLQLKNLYKHVYGAMNDKLAGDKPSNFDAVEYMQNLFNEISDRENPETAAKFLQQVPKFIGNVVINDFSAKMNLVNNFMDVVMPSIQEYSSEDALPGIIEKFTKKEGPTNNDLLDTADFNKKNENATIIGDPEEEEKEELPEGVKKPERFKSFSVFAGTLPAFKKVNPNEKEILKPEELNEERVAVEEILSTINDQYLMEEDLTKPFTYKGKLIKVKATNLETFVLKYQSAVDKATRDEVFFSAKQVKNKTAKEGVTQANERVILVLTDENGAELYFDKKGDFTVASQGQLAYQLLKDVRNTGDGYKVTNIYGNEELLASAETIAKETYEEALDGKYEDYLKQVTKNRENELKELFKLRNKAVKEDVLLDFNGMSRGISDKLSGAEIPLSKILFFPGVQEKDLANIETLTKARNGIPKGRAYITLNGNRFMVNRSKINDKIIKDIVDVIFNPNIPYELKKRFYSQFIPENDQIKMSPLMRKHSIMPTDAQEALTIELFSKVGLNAKDSISKIYVTNDLIKKTDKKQINLFKEQLTKALKEGDKDNTYTYISYPSIKKSQDFLEYNADTEELDSGDYVAHLETLEGTVVISDLDPGFYNKNLLFGLPSSVSENLKNIQDEVKDLVNQTPTTAKEIKDALADRLRNGESITGTITRPPGAETGFEFTEANGNIAYFYNQYKKDPSITQLDMTSEDIIEGAKLVLVPFKEADGKVFTDVVEVYKDDALVGNVQETDYTREPKIEALEKEIEIEEQINVPSTDNPQTNLNDLFSGLNLDSLRRQGFPVEKITQEELDGVQDFWNNTALGKDMQKYISPVTMNNIMNSNVNAEFFINGAALLNPEIKVLGGININPLKGTFVDMYHEAWHVFTQLYMTKQQKEDLYDEVKNFKDKDGKQPYINMNAFQIEEMLAEDFRTYMKKANTKKGMPKRNILFRMIEKFLRFVFGVKTNENSINLATDAMAVPSVRTMFEKLQLSDKHPQLLNDYSASINNAMFFNLDRGVRSVENDKKSVLSEQDGMLLTDSADMVISDMIDSLVTNRKNKGETKDLKSGTLGMLLEPEKRAFTFTYVKAAFKENLDYFKTQLKKLNDKPSMSSYDSFQNILDNAVAVLVADKEVKKSAEDKYVFLQSQIDDFQNLIPDIKKGERVKGETWHKIKIVGDFYKHKTIKHNGKNVSILVVSRMSDALLQYENYKEGGAQVYKDLKTLKRDKKDQLELTQDQQFIYDNIQMLQTVLDNFGDVDYDLKGESPKGFLAYFNQNSSYDIGKSKYETDYAEDEIDEEDGSEESTTAKKDENDETNQLLKGKITGKKSMLELAQKEVLYIIHSLHKVNKDGSVPKNRLGFKEKADFRKVWSILYKSIGGVRNRQVAYKNLVKEAAKFPEIAQLLNFKYPNPDTISNTYEQDISSSFWQTFSKPSPRYVQYTLFPQMGKVLNMITGQEEDVVTSYESDVTDSSLATFGTVKKFESNFKGSLGTKYILKNLDNQSVLNIQGVIEDFSNKTGDELDLKEVFGFLETLGIKLDNTEVVQKQLNDNLGYYGVEFLYDVVAGFNQIEQNKTKATARQLEILNEFKSNPISVLTTEIPSGILPNFTGPVLEKTVVNRLAEIQVKYGYDSANPGMLLPDGNLVYGTVNHSQVSVIADGVNTAEKLSDLWSNEENELSYMRGFNPAKNTFTLRSKVFASIFNTKDIKKGFPKRKGKGLEVLHVSGTRIGDEGTNTTDLEPIGKFMQEQNTMLIGGVAEFVRMAEKKSSFGAKVSGGIHKFIANNVSKGDDANLWVDVSMFRNPTNLPYSDGELFAIDNYFIDYLAVEFDRIRKFKQNREEGKKIMGLNRVVGKNKKGEDIYAGEVFTLFDNLITRGENRNVQKLLYKLVNEPAIDLPSYIKAHPELRKLIIEDITAYFNETVERLNENYASKSPFLEKKLLSKLGYTQEQIDADPKLLRSDKVTNALLKAYAYNDWIHKFEMVHIFMGDPAQFDHDKDNFHKRGPGSQSDGDGHLADKAFQKFVNEVFNKVTYATKESERTGKKLDKFVFNGKFNTGIIQDAVRESIYLPEYQEAWTEYYTDLLKNKYKGEELKQKVKERVAIDSKPFEKMTESDGCGLIGFDAYRLLKKAANQWSPSQDNLYKDIISGVEVDPKKVKQFFPVFKLHYYGDIDNSPIAVRAMFKFALNPIIPTIAVKGTALYNLHTKMMEDNLQFVVFSSGSKVASLTNRTDGKSDNMFGDKDMQSVNKDADIRPNVIHLEFLKDVTKVADKLKNEISVGTQQRMVVLDSLFDAGELRNAKNKTVVNEYQNAVSSYTNLLEKELLNKIGYELKDGKYQGKLDKLVELIREELGAKEVPENLIKLLDTRVNGSLSMDFSIHPEADVIEKIIVNRIQKSIVKQKTKGESMVQMPTTFYNGIWDSAYQKDEAIKKNDALIKKYLGSNNLPFFRRGEVINEETGERANTHLMKVAIPLNGDFLNILKVKHNDGQPIGDVVRLNEMIKNDTWLAKHRELVTVAGPRIPTDKANVIVAAEVWHFLDAAQGNTVIVPSEIVAAAGSDFDVDKLFLMFPNIDSNGELIKEVENFDETVDKINEAKKKDKKIKGADSVIAQQKKYLQNKLIKTTVSLLALPENFALLTKPNATYLVEDNVEFFEKYTSQYNQKENRHGEPVRTNSNKTDSNGEFIKVTSPSRAVDIEKNLSVHDKNLTGSKPLGIFAKKNKTHIIFKSIGAKLPSTYKVTVWNDQKKRYDELDIEQDMVLRMRHRTQTNKQGKEVISLSHETNVENEKIGDIISHGLQGLLDRANNPFPKTLNIITESSSLVLHLIESGVGVMDALAFINNPLAVDYFMYQQLLGSSLGKLVEPDLQKHQVKGKSASMVVKDMESRLSSEDAETVDLITKEINREKLYKILDLIKRADKNKKYLFYFVGDPVAKFASAGYILGDNTFPVDQISVIKEYDENIPLDKQKTLFSYSNSLISNDNYYLAAQKIWNKAFEGAESVDGETLKNVVMNKDKSSLKSLALFLHLIQIEKQSKGMSDLEIMFSPDTGLLDTALLVKQRDQAYKNFSQMSKIDKETLENLRYKSMLSSFYKSDLILDIVLPLFPLRLNDQIQEFISDTLLNNRDFVAQKFGAGQKGQERFINGFNNAVVHYILQNNMSNFNTPEGDVVELPESYHSIPVVEARDQDTSVAIKDGEIKIDVDQVIEDYKNKVFLNTNQGEKSNATKGLDTFNISENPFPTLNTYVKYLTELAYLKTQHTPKSLENNKRFKRFVANNNSEQIGYEKYMSELALMKSYNQAFIMGKTKYSYTNMVMETITEFDSENLKDRFPILAQLSPVKNVKDVNVLELNNKSDAKGNVAETYYKNLRQLADSSVRKSTNDFDSDRISEIFEDFSLMMFYQHGAGYSRHGFTKVLDPVKYLETMSAGANSFLNNNLKTLVFDEILNRMRVKSPFKNYLTTPANYSDPQPMSEEEKQAWFSELQDIVDESGTIEIEPEDVDEEGPETPPTQSSTSVDNTNKPILNSLPNKSSVPTMTYAGIGSRQTPQKVLDKMTEVAKYLDGLGYTLQTGFTFKNKETNLDEEGADKAFSDGSKNKTLFGPYGIRKTVKGLESADKYNEAVTEKSSAIVKEVHPAPDRLTPGAIKLMARNTNQIFGKDLNNTVDFVLFYAEETSNPLRPKGGTGQAVEMARRKGIPTINMADTNWRDQLKTVLAKPTQPVGPVSQTNKPKGIEVKEGIYVNQGALTKEEQLELFDYLKPYLEEQGAKTNKGTQASKMMGLGLRWDYKSNNKGKSIVDTKEIILPASKNKYGYYSTSINNQPLAPISNRFRELMTKATGIDMTNYDGAIINLYSEDNFITSHNDVDESITAINYPVIGVNLGGNGNFSIEPRDGTPIQTLNLESGTAYAFGVDGINREVYHRTFPTPQDSFLPELTTKLDGKTYPAGSYRVTITMRRIMPLEPGMPSTPSITTTEPKATQIISANVPQNKVSGVESFGSTVTANDEVIKALGSNAHSIDMIEAGFRTRTTRSESELAKYALKVGDTIKHFGKSVNGTTKNILAKVTAIHPKGTPGFKGTWAKEGWRASDVNVIDRFKDGAAAIEFEVINAAEPTVEPVGEEDFNLELTDQISILEAELANLEETKQELLERSIPVLIATNLPKIKPESARRETGVNVGTSKDINPGLLSNNGVSVERAAELINEGLFYEESGFPEIDMQDIRSYIIDILQTGVKNFVDDYTKQDKIDNLKAEIGSLKQEMQISKNKNTGIQLDIFNDQNAPEGLPSIPRSSTECE